MSFTISMIIEISYKQPIINIIVNYIHWSFVSDVLKYLDNATRQLYSDTVNAGLGIKQETKRWEDCLGNMPLSDGLSYEFVRAYFPNMTKETVSNYFYNIK
ncbi:neprilysin-11-like [Belonocnema kinseyi]|uniref:neprilysin-11-like n=1 Tax=Belonocnema kinseyi TaxID=2817044 RepID=UPI00143D5E6C|nr:neprilysin-11-like [Belonocnema kinseyi]